MRERSHGESYSNGNRLMRDRLDKYTSQFDDKIV